MIKGIDPEIQDMIDKIDRMVESSGRGKHSFLVRRDGETVVIEGRYTFRISDSSHGVDTKLQVS